VTEQSKITYLQDRCKNDLKFLVTKIMQMPRWNDELHGGAQKIIEAPGDRKLLLLPRGHQKSTIFSVAWVIQQILKDPDIRVKIVSATWPLAKDLLHQIKGILTQSALPEIFGPFLQPQCRWTTDDIDVAQRTKWLKDPTISTGGIDTGKTGGHCDILLFDDLVTEHNTTTPDQVRKVIDGYRACLPLLDPGGRLLMIGTRYVNADIYGYIIENESRSINGVPVERVEQRKEWRKLYAQSQSKEAPGIGSQNAITGNPGNGAGLIYPA